MSIVRKDVQARVVSPASACVAELSHIESQAIFCVAGTMEALLEQSLDLALRSRQRNRAQAAVPAGSDLDIRRQAGGTHEALGVRDRPLVKCRNATRERV